MLYFWEPRDGGKIRIIRILFYSLTIHFPIADNNLGKRED